MPALGGALSNPIRILIVDDGIGFGGAIVSTANLIRALDRTRFEPIFVSATNHALLASALKEAAPGTHVAIARRILHHYRLSAIAERIRRLPFAPFRKFVETLFYGLRHLVNLPYTLRLAYLGLRYRADLVQLNLGLGQDEAAVAAILLRNPRVVFLRGYWGMGRIQMHVFAPGIRKFVAVSRYIADRVIEGGVEPERVTVATSPVILEEVSEASLREVRDRHDLAPGLPLFGIFGRVVPWKGQLESLRAAALVLELVPTAKALVVGDASDGDQAYMSHLVAFVQERGLEGRIIFTGYRDDVATYYTLLDVSVHASIEPEPSGRVIFEAMSYGTPVVASHLGGPKEFVEEGVDGFIVDPTDAARVAERVVTLLRDNAMRDRMGAHGKEKMRRLYGPEPYARQVEAVYDEVVGASPPEEARKP
ncbi:MAG: glycosyltransferase family 4 protein [Gemmatimonadota bacterium]